MSLRVWLPLTKDLRNQGLDDVTVTNNGATFNSTGKLGGSYTGRIDVSSSIIPTILNGSEFTVAFWIYINEVPTGSGVTDTYVMACGTGGTRTQFHIAIRQNGAGFAFCFYSDDYTFYNTVTDKVGKWMHVVCAFKNNTQIVYVDGIKIGERATAGGLNIAANSVLNIYATHERLNDVRIYDHCLSPLEVKQISQGLILHYPLNRNGWGQENLITGYDTSFLSYPDGTVTLFVNQMNGGAQEIVSNIGGATKCLHLHSNGGNSRQYRTLSATSGKSYTISCDYYSTSSQAVPFRGELNGGNYNWAGSNAAAYTTPNKWVRLSFSYLNLTSDATIFYFIQCSQNTDCYIKNLKIEEGSIATPWCPNSSDALATTLGMNDNIEYDCSGYCNNGEYYAYDTNGSISYTSDTPKYNVSTRIASANPTQSAASGTRYLYGHCELMNPTQMSVAFWLKPITGGYSGTTSNGQGYFCTTNYEYGDTSVGVDYQASAMNHRDGNVDMNDSASTTQCRVTFYPTIGEWHHYVYTYDGQVGRGYKDGVQTATAQFSAAKTLDSFIGVVIGFSKAGGVWRRNDACYSDFRIYATALSADDIKDLYNLGASIDSNNNLLTYELNEE